MSIASTRETFEKYRQAAESGDPRNFLALYADDAEVVDINKRTPPASPERHSGRSDIGTWLSKVPNDLEHWLTDEVIGEDRMAFTYHCRYPNGQEVVGVHVCQLGDGKIKREVVAEAWDE